MKIEETFLGSVVDSRIDNGRIVDISIALDLSSKINSSYKLEDSPKHNVTILSMLPLKEKTYANS